MTTNRELARRIWVEFVQIHGEGAPSRRAKGTMSDMLPCGGGKSLIISAKIALDIQIFARLVHDNDATLRVSMGSKDIGDAARRSFGEVLVTIDLEDDPEEASERLLREVGQSLNVALSPPTSEQIYVFGCWLIRDEFVDDISFGPVRFEKRDAWLERMHREKRASDVLVRRLRHLWNGNKLRPLKNPYNQMKEKSFVDAIGSCPMVCTVASNGLAAEAGRHKAMLAARLALMAVALIWERPSTALDGFGLLVDGEARNQHYLMLGEPGAWSSIGKAGRLIGSTWIPKDDWQRLWADHRWLTEPFGDVFNTLIRPTEPVVRPNINRSLIHALWWFYEACRADAPLMAAAKFGTCLDVLAGGQSVGKILQLIKARCGSGPDDAITPDGRTARAVVNTIYSSARSQTMHGSNERYDHDWTGTRDLAEHLTRRCFVEVLSWLEDHPEATTLAGALIEDERLAVPSC